jgi:hypothetical protein
VSECDGCGREAETAEIDERELCLVCLDGKQETAARKVSQE